MLQHHSYTPNSKLGNVTKLFFEIRSEVVTLKLSFAFLVLPSKTFSNSVSLLSSKSIYKPYFINNVFWKTWPRFLSLVFMRWLYQHCICTNYSNQWNNLDSDIYCPRLKQHETIKPKNWFHIFQVPSILKNR